MIDKNLQAQLKNIVSDPAWRDIIVRRFQYNLERKLELFLKAAKPEDFRYHQGRYEEAKELFNLMKDARNFSDDGIVQMQSPSGEERP